MHRCVCARYAGYADCERRRWLWFRRLERRWLFGHQQLPRDHDFRDHGYGLVQCRYYFSADCNRSTYGSGNGDERPVGNKLPGKLRRLFCEQPASHADCKRKLRLHFRRLERWRLFRRQFYLQRDGDVRDYCNPNVQLQCHQLYVNGERAREWDCHQQSGGGQLYNSNLLGDFPG